MRNITIAIDDETYRKARVIAALRDTSVSGIVKKFLLSLASETSDPRSLKQEQEALLDSIWRRHPEFTAADNLSRNALHERS